MHGHTHTHFFIEAIEGQVGEDRCHQITVRVIAVGHVALHRPVSFGSCFAHVFTGGHSYRGVLGCTSATHMGHYSDHTHTCSTATTFPGHSMGTSFIAVLVGVSPPVWRGFLHAL